MGISGHTRRLSWPALVATVGCLSFGAAPADARPAPDPRDTSLAVTGYALESMPTRIVDREAHALTTVGVDGVTVRPSGAAVTAVTSEARAMVRRTHRDGLRAELLVSNFDARIGDFSPGLGSKLLRHKANRVAVVRQLARFVRHDGWDGITIDLEALRRADGNGLLAFARQLRRELPAGKGVSICLSAATRAGQYRAMGYRLRGLARAVDVVALMAYDEHGPTWSGPGPIGPLGWQRKSLTALGTLVPASKIDLGVAGYGYTWPDGHTGRSVSPRQARELVASDDATAQWVAHAGEWHARLSDGTELWWSDARSWRLRVAIAERRGLHGLALWRLGSADPLP